MKRAGFIKFIISFCLLLTAVFGISAQDSNSPQVKNQKVSETDKTPAIIKHLPDWENAQSRAVYISNEDELRKSLGERPVFDLIKFEGGTEAVTADYPQGKLLIIEYPTPQAATEANAQIRQRLTEMGQNPTIFFRRIGNYGAFVFDAADEAAANTLFEQIKYEKTIHWLDEAPVIQAYQEREFALGLGDVFISTVIFVLIGLGVMLTLGTVVGLIFYYVRERQRLTRNAFTDAGGMTRLNLDELTSPISSGRLLNE